MIKNMVTDVSTALRKGDLSDLDSRALSALAGYMQRVIALKVLPSEDSTYHDMDKVFFGYVRFKRESTDTKNHPNGLVTTNSLEDVKFSSFAEGVREFIFRKQLSISVAEELVLSSLAVASGCIDKISSLCGQMGLCGLDLEKFNKK